LGKTRDPGRDSLTEWEEFKMPWRNPPPTPKRGDLVKAGTARLFVEKEETMHERSYNGEKREAMGIEPPRVNSRVS